MAKSTYYGMQKIQRGFTLIELMVTLAIAAVLATLAAPSIRDFIVRSKLNNIGNEFTGSILRSRNEAINRNTCVTMCISTKTATDDTPACTTTGTNWQVGWIAFLNPSCDSRIKTPDAINMLLARQNSGNEYYIQAQSNSKSIMFNSRGIPGLGSADQFNIIYQDINNSLSEKYGFNVCLDGLGRTRTLPENKVCSTYK